MEAMTTIREYTITLDNNCEEEWEYADAKDEVQSVLDSAPHGHYFIASESIGWRGVTGFTVVPWTGVVDALTLRGDYRLDFVIDDRDNTLIKVMRYSHDEPTGVRFIVRPATEDEIEQF